MIRQNVIVLGSTGSVGTQTLDVVRAARGCLNVVGLGANGSDVALLARQAMEFEPNMIAIADIAAVRSLEEALAYLPPSCPRPQVLSGPQAMVELARQPTDKVVNGITGTVGLDSTLSALRSGTVVALANKESLISGGPLLCRYLREGLVRPVDSEHAAIAHCLRAGNSSDVKRLVVTASGGPFRGKSQAGLQSVSVADSLRHPTWLMGKMISVNSATLVNKGLEVLEAHELFGIAYQDIDIVVHPQSIVHSMVEFMDGSTVLQASRPDLRLAISQALFSPEYLPSAVTPLDWRSTQSWTFEPVDANTFPAIELAREAGEARHGRPAIYNAANEEGVNAFLDGRVAFLDIVDTVEKVLTDAPTIGEPETLEQVRDIEEWARTRARELLGTT